jgi:predicted AAA+ superfamily ATPase
VRYARPVLEAALDGARQMVFLAGPRQVGKTTLARYLLAQVGCEALYFNWDIDAHRRAIVKDPSGFFRSGQAASAALRREEPRLVLDEIHKYPRWKRFLKGFFDEHERALQLLVTGSGRLDLYQRGGDSLFGRYDLYHLHPFTLGEWLAGGEQSVAEPASWLREVLKGPRSVAAAREANEALRALERFSGFPEPLHAGTEARLRKWRRAHRELVVRQDLRDLTRIRELGLIESLVLLLPERVASPLSVHALATELGVAFNTVRGWLDALARLYFLFEIRPWAGKLARTLRRETKTYLFDPTEIPDPGPRFENVVALHLYKLCDLWTDQGLGDFELRYVRDKEKREIDFVIVEGRRPWLLVEAKLSDDSVSPALRYFHERLKPSHGSVQLVRNLDHARTAGTAIHLVPASWALAKT